MMQSRRPGSCICGLRYRAKGITIPSYDHSYSKSVIQLGIVWVCRETRTSHDMLKAETLVFGCVGQGIWPASLWDFPVVTSHLTLGIPDYRHALSTATHLAAQDRIQIFRSVCQMLQTLSHYLSPSQTSSASSSIYFLRM